MISQLQSINVYYFVYVVQSSRLYFDVILLIGLKIVINRCSVNNLESIFETAVWRHLLADRENSP